MRNKVVRFLENDKVKHFVFMYFGTSVLMQLTGWVLVPIIIMTIIGLIKEAGDKPFDWKDIAANIAGILLSVLLYVYGVNILK